MYTKRKDRETKWKKFTFYIITPRHLEERVRGTAQRVGAFGMIDSTLCIRFTPSGRQNISKISLRRSVTIEFAERFSNYIPREFQIPNDAGRNRAGGRQ